MTSDSDRGAIAYENGDYLVVVDRGNPQAWIRSDVTVDAEDYERERCPVQE